MAASTDAANRELVEDLVSRVTARHAAGELRVEELRTRGGRAEVDLTLVTPEGALRVRIENREGGRPAFAHTPSFGVSYLGREEPGRVLLGRLQAFVRELARHDPGGLALAEGARRLPVVNGPDDDPTAAALHEETSWSRARFDERFDALLSQRTSVRHVTVVISEACEMNCQFCPESDRGFSIDVHARDTDVQLADVLHQIERGRELDARTLELGGNDVLRFARIVDACEAAVDAGYAEIRLQAIGSSLDEAKARALGALAGVVVELPIYGRSAAIHDRVTQTPGSFDGLVRGVDHANAHGLEVRLHTIALGSTADELEALIRFCRERFDLHLTVTCLQPNRLGQSEHLVDTAPYARVRPLLERHPAHFLDHFPLCQFPEAVAREVLSRGPRDHREGAVNFFDVGLAADSADAAVAELRHHHHVDACGGCTARLACPGPLGSYLSAHGADEIHPL